MKKIVRTALLGTIGGFGMLLAGITTPSLLLEEGISHGSPVGVARPTLSASPFPSVSVRTPSVAPRVSVSPSGHPIKKQRMKTPASAAPTPSPARKPVRVTPTPKITTPVQKATIISTYRACFGFAQSCIDGGYLTLYNPGQLTLAGHNYLGYQWMSRLPVGSVVKVIGGQVAGTYKVYGHAWSERAKAGGRFPDAGRAADLVLQTCEPNGTGFSLLRRV